VSQISRTGSPPSIRMVHLGLGNFFRAHQAWYTAQAPDAEEWGIAAFTGRSAELAATLDAQDGLYTLITRAPHGDQFGIVGSIARAHAAADVASWLAYLADRHVSVVTLTVTEAAYRTTRDGRLDRSDPDVIADIETLRRDPGAAVRTVPGRLIAGLIARRAADAGPLTVVSCDNVPRNGSVLAGALADMAEAVDVGLAAWIADNVTAPTTMVDRITPRSTHEDIELARKTTGVDDRAPVVTEPFSEWVLSGAFAGRRPSWEAAGAIVTDDAAPYEQRKLWLLNGAHSLLAYAGSSRGHCTVAEAIDDDVCRSWVHQWWAEARTHVSQPAAALEAYTSALLDRFANPRMRHLLAQIAADGSQKLPIRVLPVLKRERATGRLPHGAIRTLAGWISHLRAGEAVTDPQAGTLQRLAAGTLTVAVLAVLRSLDASLADDTQLVAAVTAAAQELGAE
jgi:fructuronate reductase